jgi:protoheme IX farnesyltransferase
VTDILRLLRALLTLSKPRIVAVELLAGLAGALLVSPHLPPPGRLLGLSICLGLTAAAACMANCLLEADTDLLMKRYASRSRALETAGGKTVLIALLLLGGGGITLAIPFCNPFTALLLGLAFFCYAELYTGVMKRHTPWSVLVGGIPGALPPIIGAVAVDGTISPPPLLLGLLIYLWQLPHFWLLALQHRRSYQEAGVPVLPVVMGERATGRLVLLCACALAPFALVFSLSAGHPPLITVLLVGAAVAFARNCHETITLTRDFHSGFIASLTYLGGTLLLAMAGRLLMNT